MAKETSDQHTPAAQGEAGPKTFSELLGRECAVLGGSMNDYRCAALDGADEPWVAFTTQDRLGLALSGGGIRSATFNLGILQALQQKRLLGRLDYLSTVSGGGYIGGFWTRWRHYQKTHGAASTETPFPWSSGGACGNKVEEGPKEIREPAEFRHLREFSRFLIPRKGLTVEFWSAAITILEGLVPALVATLAAVLLVMTLWVYLAALLIYPHPSLAQAIPTGLVVVVLVAIFLAVMESRARLTGQFADNAPVRKAYRKCCLWASAGLAAGWCAWEALGLTSPAGVTLGWNNAGQDLGLEYNINWRLFGPCIALAMSLLVLTLLRLWSHRFGPAGRVAKPGDKPPTPADFSIEPAAALDRVMGRLLAIQCVWVVMASMWEVARWLDVKAVDTGFSVTGETGCLTGVLAMLFVWARRWLTESKDDQGQSSLWKRLKPLAPALLANGIVALLCVLAAVFILDCGMRDGYWPKLLIPGLCVPLLLCVLVLFNPMTVGLHEFYRARIARCYLGAALCANPTKRDRKYTEGAEDDMTLADDKARPIHLICCAANDVDGDTMGTLHRGARSVTLSRYGVTLGDQCAAAGNLRLSTALTASAAAFNSLMGELNMKFGRAVAFVMTALNLRLGLWVKNPACSAAGSETIFQRFPGLFFFKEMLGFARCHRGEPQPAYIHLSDGGHFENLALYELIRRHCRYIIVSDAGQDNEYAFADLGRAVRRVREDFGVEIAIDLAPLRPGPDGCALQHLAVGIIHYDGVTGTDKGTLVYFKPTITGDEPADILQYRQREPLFPHESTGDQFFDEAQWESYRRLGTHATYTGLRVIEQLTARSPQGPAGVPVETLFRDIRLQWQRVPWMQGDGGIRLCEHAAGLEDALRDHASSAFCREFGRDLAGDMSVRSRNDASGPETPAPLSTDTAPTTDDLLLAMRIGKFMEEAWCICDLDQYWSHPLASNWMSYLHHWAAMPTLRYWWRILRPFFGARFLAFADEHLNLMPTTDASSAQATLELKAIPSPKDPRDGFAWRRLHECRPEFTAADPTATLFELRLTLHAANDRPAASIQVGLAVVAKRTIDAIAVASWRIEDLFVPPELQGGGLTTALLDKLIEHLTGAGVQQIKVAVGNHAGSAPDNDTHARLSLAERQKQVELIDFYRSRRFVFDGKTWERGQNTSMVRSCICAPEPD